MHNWNIYINFNEASKQAAEFLASSIEDFIVQNNVCHVILPGGNTPVATLKLLAQQKINWEKVHWYLGDERCLPPDNSERNDLMLENNLWSKINNTHIHRIAAELGAEEAAAQYRNDIKGIKEFDIAFLGMGEDGHTASLFPEHEALNDHRSAIPVYNSPKPPSDRVSLSLDTLRKSKIKIVLVGGNGKAQIISKIKLGEPLPINSIGEVNWFIDDAANNTQA